jgi:CBS domain-containing protein
MAITALTAGGLCKRNVIALQENEDIAAAASLMRDHHVGYLVVTSQPTEAGANRVSGVLTDRDIIVAVVANGVDPHFLRVSDVMTRAVLLVEEEYSIDVVLRFMREAGVRRVPVVGKDGQLVGVLSFDDVLDSIVRQLTCIADSISTEQQTERLVRTGLSCAAACA